MFLYKKIRSYSLSNLLRLEVEAWVFMLLSPFPGTLGFITRWLAGKILFRKTVGFQWIQPSVYFVHASRITLGKNVGINSNCYLNGVGEIDIGNFVLLGNNITISSGKHPINGKYPEIFERPTIPMKIIIEDGVWIGSGSVIMPGITLRRGCVIGANSVVTKDTDLYSINVGSPAKCIGFR